MILPTASLAARRAIGLFAAALCLAACPASDDSDTGAGTDATDASATTVSTTMTATTADASGESSAETTPMDVDYATDIQPIWTANCITGCHEAGGIYAALDLTAANSYDMLTTLKPVYSTESNFLVAGDSAESFLIDALRASPGIIVRQMPLVLTTDAMGNPIGDTGTPLPEATIALIEAWIDAGANP